MAIYALDDVTPDIHPDAYVHPDAIVIGRVTVGSESSVWPGAVLRGDYGPIVIGERTSIQDGAVLHATERTPTHVGSDCVVGHVAHLEGSVVEDGCLIGSGSVVLNAVVRAGAIVGAAALVGNGLTVPERAVASGVPARIRLDAADPATFQEAVAMYVGNAKRYRAQLRRIG